MMRLLKLLFPAAVAVLLGGCLVYNTEPLSPAATAKVDTALLGAWKSRPDTDSPKGERLEVDVSRKGDNGLLIAVTSYERDGSTRQHVYQGHASAAGDQHYLNIFTTEAERNLHGYLTVRYAIDGDALSVQLIDVPAARMAVQQGELEGMVTLTSEMSDVTITADGESFTHFLQQHPDVFAKPVEFVRRK